jgi:hypothetical protein
MSNGHRTAFVFAAIGLLALAGCRVGPKPIPSILANPNQVQAGTVVRVTGQNWRPGERIVVGLNAPQARAQDSQQITSALADATGRFVELFSFPTHERWSQMADITVVACSPDFTRVASATLHCTQPGLVTPISPLLPSATPPAGNRSSVLGYVLDVSPSASLIHVKPVEGQAETIALLQATRITRDGQPIPLGDIRPGDLVEATGQPGAGNSVIADEVRLMSSSSLQPTPSVARTPTRSALSWRGAYYGNTAFSGNPSLVREDAVIDFQWLDAAPVAGLPADNFAVRWTGTWPLETGTYRFYAQVDDGVRLWLDDHLMLEQWHESNGDLYSIDAYVSAGPHAIKVEYFNIHGSALARVWWESRGGDAPQPFPEWKGEYYANPTLSGTPFLVMNDRVLDFNWGTGALGTGMPADNVSVRWTRTLSWEPGMYRFSARADDGVRLWVDNSLVIDHWQDGPAATNIGDVYLSQGAHAIRIEYFEHTGLAEMRVGWELLPNTPTPTSIPLPPTSATAIAPTPTSQPPIPQPTSTPASPA